MKKEMLINVAQPEECRIAVIEGGQLEDLFIERASQDSYVGNIYKGRIVNIEPSIQAAFVDFGIGRNGFLHVSDVDPAYYKHLLSRDQQARFDDGDDDDGGPPPLPRGRRDDRGPRRNDRRDGPTPAPMTAWLPPEQLAAPADGGLLDDDGFAAGLDDAPQPPPLPKPRLQPPPVAAARPRPAPAEPVDPDESGFGLGLDDDEPSPPPTTARLEIIETVVEPDADDSGFGTGLDPDDAPAAESKAKAKAPRRGGKKKADEVPPVVEEKKPAKPRRGKKKADGDDDAPPVMGAAEHRTTAGDDDDDSGFGAGLDDNAPARPKKAVAPVEEATEEEAPVEVYDDESDEVKPFFDETDFDPDAPNDRFGPGGAAPPRKAAAENEEELPDEGEGSFGGEEDDEPAGEPEPIGVGVVDDDEFAPPKSYDDDSGPPRRRTGGGDRDRGGPRDRDRRGPPRGDRRPGPGGPGGPGGGRPGRREFPRLPIEKIFKKGQEVIVQVIKEGIGTKGPTLSTYVSIAGRYLVLMPSLNRFGVSRKIEDFEARRRLREIMNEMNPPKGVGFIVRTAAIDRNPAELQGDLAYLLRLWQVMVRRIQKVRGPAEIYRESDMITRTIRDNFTADIDAVYVDDATAFTHAAEFMQIVMPKFADRIKLHDSLEPLFTRFRLDEELAKINQKRIELPQGGSLIIEQTEALVAIDVNSGNFRADNNAEETAFRLNMIAAKEIARQLRLRDLGGVIVNDFIDMRDEKHRRSVEEALETALRRDKARTKVLRISQFGIIEMTRQRIQPSLKKRVYNECGNCRGTSYVKTNETMGIEVMRTLQLAAHKAASGTPPITAVQLTVHPDVAFHLLNRKRRDVAALEDRAKIEVTILSQVGVSPDLMEVKCYDANGTEVRLASAGPPPRMFTSRPPRFPERS